MKEIKHMLERMVVKYSSGVWIGDKVADGLVVILSSYIEEVGDEIKALENAESLPPTVAPNAEYDRSLVTWYKEIGRGDRYNKAKIQQMIQVWPFIKHLYEEGTSPWDPSLEIKEIE